MSETASRNLSGVAETLLIPLYIRAMESRRPDALMKDGKAVELVMRMSLDFSRVRQIPLSEANKPVIILRNREFDRYARDFLARCPEAVVVHIGCGLDSRFERVDNGQVEWYDLDLPQVIELRRKFIGDERERYHLLGYSVLDIAWLGTVSAHRQRPFLFMAEGVSMHFRGAQVESLVLTLRDRFPGAELVFDAYSPVHLWVSNLRTARSGFRCHWALWRGQEIEGWGDGIRLLDEWGYFDCREPRLAPISWMRPIESLLRTLRIYHWHRGAVYGHREGVSFMFGSMAVLQDALFALMPSLLLVASLVSFRRRTRTTLPYARLVSLVLLVAVNVVWIPTLWTHLYHKASHYLFLDTLKATDVATITIGETVWNDQSDVQDIVCTLNQPVWHSVNFDFAKRTETMTVSLHSGATREFRIGRHDTRDGALIEFFRLRASGFWADGDTFIPRLPAVLERLGHPLASE